MEEPTIKRSELPQLKATHGEVQIVRDSTGSEFAAQVLDVDPLAKKVALSILARIVDE